MIIKNLQALILILLLTIEHGMHAAWSGSNGKVPTLQELAFNKLKPDLEVMLKNIEDEDNFEKINFIQDLTASSDVMPEFKANFKNEQGIKTLMDAISKDDIEKVKRLIQLDVVDVNQKDDSFFGETPLHVAIEYEAYKVIPLLVKAGADVNQKNNYDLTPLHYAALNNAYKVILLLVKAGADINQRDNNGDTPLHLAAEGNVDKAVQLLLDADADVNQANNSGKTPLRLAIENHANKVIPLLREAGARE
ncbi:MAG: ankyrin repeat domain-containing protein [Candidatus Dependentiae bacterium]|nr:ankyrin repeat domain-containing protein [Candidatus Dependentiae bacterium]